MLAKKSNLKDGILDKSWNALMLCNICGAEYSANSGDYWNVADDYVFECCDEIMELVEKNTVYNSI